jgi:hypothetical protein
MAEDRWRPNPEFATHINRRRDVVQYRAMERGVSSDRSCIAHEAGDCVKHTAFRHMPQLLEMPAGVDC